MCVICVIRTRVRGATAYRGRRRALKFACVRAPARIDAYVGGDGGWASGEVDPDEDDYLPSGGSDGEDFGADDY